MNDIIQFCQSIFNPLVVIFTISSLLSMGLQVVIPQVIQKARNPRFMLLMFLWGWVVGPGLAYLITLILPLAEPFAAVLLIASLAPSAPFLPPLIDKARGDVNFAGAFIPVATLGTVLFMPLLIPVLVKGAAVDALTLAKPIVITVLIPLLAGALIRTYATGVADKLYRPIKVLAGLSTALTILFCFLLYSVQMLETAGSFALASITLFAVVMGVITYRFGFGLSQNERSVMSLGMGTRNIAAVLIGVLAFPNVDQRMVAMVIMYTLWTFILAQIVAPMMGKRAAKALEGGVAT